MIDTDYMLCLKDTVKEGQASYVYTVFTSTLMEAIGSWFYYSKKKQTNMSIKVANEDKPRFF